METAHEHAATAPELLAIHALAGCDSVAHTYGVGKTTAIAVTKKSFRLGNTTIDVAEILSQTTTFMAACYGEGTGCSSMTECYQRLWAQRMGRSTEWPLNCALSHQLQRSLHNMCSGLIISWHSGIVRYKVSTGLMPRNMADGVPYEPDFILKLLCHLCVSGRMCLGGKCGCMSCQLVCTIFCACRRVKDVWIPSIHTQGKCRAVMLLAIPMMKSLILRVI